MNLRPLEKFGVVIDGFGVSPFGLIIWGCGGSDGLTGSNGGAVRPCGSHPIFVLSPCDWLASSCRGGRCPSRPQEVFIIELGIPNSHLRVVAGPFLGQETLEALSGG
jgi:hypothetical protein